MSPKTRVGVYIPDLTGGGAERAMLKLAAGLGGQDVAVDFLVANAKGAYLSQIPGNVNFIDLKAGQPRSSLRDLVRYLQREQPVALVSALHNANIVALWAKKLARVPTRNILSIQNNFSAEKQGRQTLRKRFIEFTVARFYAWADEIVAVSAGVADDLSRTLGLPRERIQVIYNPVVSEALLEKSRQPLAHPWFVPGAPPVVLSVGRLNAQKDFPTLLRAFAKLRQKNNARLLILGEGEERGPLESLVSELGLGDCVSLPGFADNPFAYMRRASLYVLSSRFEGLPTVLVEALACGCPVVSTDCPSGPSEILDGGRYGPLVPVGDAPALAEAISSALAGARVEPPHESWKPYMEANSVTAFKDLAMAD